MYFNFGILKKIKCNDMRIEQYLFKKFKILRLYRNEYIFLIQKLIFINNKLMYI